MTVLLGSAIVGVGVVVVVEVRRIRHRRNDQPHARVDPHDGWFT